MAAYIEQDSGFFTRRGIVVGAILLLHLFIVWALVTGLARRAIEVIAPPVQAVFQPEDVKNTPPPPPPPPTFERPPVEIPPTDTIVEAPVAAVTTAISEHNDPARGRRAGGQSHHTGYQGRSGQGLPEQRGLLSTCLQASRGAGDGGGEGMRWPGRQAHRTADDRQDFRVPAPG